MRASADVGGQPERSIRELASPPTECALPAFSVREGGHLRRAARALGGRGRVFWNFVLHVDVVELRRPGARRKSHDLSATDQRPSFAKGPDLAGF